ncbi:MAG: DUF6596 domain-containing protein [Geodermatophilaceae bacterium]
MKSRYAASEGDRLLREDLTREGIRLARSLADLMPDEPEALGLLALMLLHDARRRTRVDTAGDLVLLNAQDRAQWDHDLIAEGAELLQRALRRRQPGPYQVQAAIAACHATAPTAAETDWRQIVGLYDQLLTMTPTPFVRLNRAVAVAMADGAGVALPLIDALADGPLQRHHLLHATRAELLTRLERWNDAAAAYRLAVERTTTEPERRHLHRRLNAITSRPLQ